MTSNMSLDAIIDSITCPITQDVMKDPVQGNDGQTYERNAIIKWLNEKEISPNTREPMSINDLKVNSSIRFLCDKYHAGEFGNISNTRKQALVSTSNIKIDHKVFKNNENKVMLNLSIDEESFPTDLEFGHLSQDIVLVIDRSGSMQAAVEAKDSNGSNIEAGFSIQDIVNHSAKTVAKTLDNNSRLAVIMFDNHVDILFNLMIMTEVNKSTALTKIESIKPRGQTNIWGATETAIKILDEREDKSRNGAIIMLTDGQPNVSPARGEIETLKRLRKAKNFTSPIYTFGFGYNLKPELLYDMAKYANGGNGHIPDGNLIATVFCNFIGTILTTVALNVQLHVIEKKTFNKDILMGDYAMQKDSNGELIYDIGTIQIGQTRNIVFNTDLNDYFSYYYTYKIGGQSYKSEEYNVDNNYIEGLSFNNDVNIHIKRYSLVDGIRKMINYNRCVLNNDAIDIFNQLEILLKNNYNNDPLTQGMIKNLVGDGSNEGQIKLAVSNMVYFKRWGEFYLDQLSRSLNQQIKPNFKDESCLFGGTVFHNIVDKASDIFDTMPPPTPSLELRNNSSYNSHSQQSYRSMVSMSAFNDAGGGCIDSNCLIDMFDGTKKQLKNVKKFDVVKSIDKNNNIVGAVVECVFETIITSGERDFIKLEGVNITPWHPIKFGLFGKEEKWYFPNELFGTYKLNCNSMITLVLDSYHIMFINNIKCITLGHNFEDNSKLKHPFYGTNLVLNNFKNNFPEDYENGKISVKDIDMNYVKENNQTTNIIYINKQ